jgi:hypothetical protein
MGSSEKREPNSSAEYVEILGAMDTAFVTIFFGCTITLDLIARTQGC